MTKNGILFLDKNNLKGVKITQNGSKGWAIVVERRDRLLTTYEFSNALVSTKPSH
jgi:hypothetical protein